LRAVERDPTPVVRGDHRLMDGHGAVFSSAAATRTRTT
jgi:hypothetical protein